MIGGKKNSRVKSSARKKLATIDKAEISVFLMYAAPLVYVAGFFVTGSSAPSFWTD
jgi:hypothetical protein